MLPRSARPSEWRPTRCVGSLVCFVTILLIKQHWHSKQSPLDMPNDPHIRFLFQWMCSFYIADSIYFLIFPKYLWVLHHVLCLAILLPALNYTHGAHTLLWPILWSVCLGVSYGLCRYRCAAC